MVCSDFHRFNLFYDQGTQCSNLFDLIRTYKLVCIVKKRFWWLKTSANYCDTWFELNFQKKVKHKKPSFFKIFELKKSTFGLFWFSSTHFILRSRYPMFQFVWLNSNLQAHLHCKEPFLMFENIRELLWQMIWAQFSKKSQT